MPAHLLPGSCLKNPFVPRDAKTLKRKYLSIMILPFLNLRGVFEKVTIETVSRTANKKAPSFSGEGGLG